MASTDQHGDKPEQKNAAQTDRQARLEEALRANLKKRKRQARARAGAHEEPRARAGAQETPEDSEHEGPKGPEKA